MTGPDIPSQGLLALEAFETLFEAERVHQKQVVERSGLPDNDRRALLLIVDEAAAGRLVRPGDIAIALAITTASVTVLISRLERTGLVRRGGRFLDRRSFGIEPTPAGIAMAQSVREIPDRVQQIFRDLPAADAHTIAAFVTRWAHALHGALHTNDRADGVRAL